LLDILAGLNTQAREEVKLNGTSLQEFNSVDHLNVIRYCPQGSYLLSGKISETVFFSDYFGKQQQQLLEDLDLNSDIASNRKVLSERGTNISGGEAKRLSLARVLANPGEVMIFDEPTSALNKDVAKKVWDKLFAVAKDKILICTTHDLDRLDDFDRVIYL
jgi:ATP-binding cassette subfamily B protein/ATP-binding cassette subfamily B protein RtxE